MSRARGLVLQNALARYLAANGWPSAESAGAGRQGTDILGTPGIVWECKTATEFKRDFRPVEWAAQARRHRLAGDVPVSVYFPPGIGALRVADSLSILPTSELVELLRERMLLT